MHVQKAWDRTFETVSRGRNRSRSRRPCAHQEQPAPQVVVAAGRVRTSTCPGSVRFCQHTSCPLSCCQCRRGHVSRGHPSADSKSLSLILFPEHVLSGFGHSVLSFRRQFFRIWSGVRVHRTEPFLHQGQKDPAWSRGPVQQSGALSFHLAAPFPACEREQNSSVRHSGTNRTGLVPCA